MILQNTTNKALSHLPVAHMCNTIPVRSEHIGMYSSKFWNDKKYWPGWYRT